LKPDRAGGSPGFAAVSGSLVQERGRISMDAKGSEPARRLVGKRALVTGAGTGIGRAVGLEFAREGAAIALQYAHSSSGASSAVEEINRCAGRAKAFHADFDHLDSVHRLAGEALEYLGGLDILVNNAGISMNEPFEKVTPEQFDLLYHVNFRAMFFLTQAVLPAMLAQGRGVVINMTSIQAFAGNRENTVYGSTKGAIVSFTRHLAIELAPRGIRVNAIAPGAIEVENYYKADPDFDPEALGRTIPAGFTGQPWDIARAAVFLATDDSRYILGQTLIVDGGTTSWIAFTDDFRKPDNAVWGKGYVPGR
jgi:NAD(P)-dependent dehydrogenase (short-subunit alcohol dehydrogenase family)